MHGCCIECRRSVGSFCARQEWLAGAHRRNVSAWGLVPVAQSGRSAVELHRDGCGLRRPASGVLRGRRRSSLPLPAGLARQVGLAVNVHSSRIRAFRGTRKRLRDSSQRTFATVSSNTRTVSARTPRGASRLHIEDPLAQSSSSSDVPLRTGPSAASNRRLAGYGTETGSGSKTVTTSGTTDGVDTRETKSSGGRDAKPDSYSWYRVEVMNRSITNEARREALAIMRKPSSERATLCYGPSCNQRRRSLPKSSKAANRCSRAKRVVLRGFRFNCRNCFRHWRSFCPQSCVPPENLRNRSLMDTS